MPQHPIETSVRTRVGINGDWLAADWTSGRLSPTRTRSSFKFGWTTRFGTTDGDRVSVLMAREEEAAQ